MIYFNINKDWYYKSHVPYFKGNIRIFHHNIKQMHCLFAKNITEENLQLNQSFSKFAVTKKGESKYLQRERSTNDFIF